MAGDWIKMRSDLHTHPKVVRIASALRADRLRVVGGLHAVWSLFDMHSSDGFLDGYTAEALDELIGFAGFSSALSNVGWIATGEDFLEIPRFDEHNGQSAKRRAQDAERKRDARKTSAPEADAVRTREEKRREDVNPLSPIGDIPPADAHRKTSGTPKRAAQLPDDFRPTEKHAALAAEQGVSLRDEFPKFRDYYAAHGKGMKDWSAALNNWIRNAKKFGGSTNANGIRKPTAAEQRQAVADELCGRNKPPSPAEGAIDGSAKWVD